MAERMRSGSCTDPHRATKRTAMKNVLLILAGLAIGYFAGFKDARKHDRNIVVRAVESVGGDARANVVTDVDKQMDSAER